MSEQELTPGQILIRAHSGHAVVSRVEQWHTGSLFLIGAHNWQELEGKAWAEVEAQGGWFTLAGDYQCSPELAHKAHFPQSPLSPFQS